MSDHVTVIPVFNEAATIGALVARAALHGPVIVVDDGSGDGSDGAGAGAGGGRPRAGARAGFRVYPRDLLERVAPRRGGFVFETEVLVRAAAAGYVIREVPISAFRPASRPSRFRPFRDGVAVTGYLVGQGLRRWARDAG